MPEKPSLRYEVFTGQWVVLAPARASPFCPGNEQMTEREVLRLPDPGGRGWRVRVVPNKYAAVDRALSPSPESSAQDPLSREMPGFGIHDVVIESPDHRTPLAL